MPGAPPGTTPAYLSPGPHQLNYYRQYPGVMHMASGDARGTGRIAAAAVAAAAAGIGGGGVPPDEAPPLPYPSPMQAAASGQQHLPKESILESLLAARSERLSAASLEAEEAATAAAVAALGSAPMQSTDHETGTGSLSKNSSGSGSGANRSTKQQQGAKHGATGRATTGVGLGKGVAKRVPEGAMPKAGGVAGGFLQQAAPLVPNSPLRRADAVGAGMVGLEGPAIVAASGGAAATAAATAMHLSGLHGGFPADIHHMMGAGIGGMTPQHHHPSVGNVPSAGNGSPAMHYIAAAGALPPPPRTALSSAVNLAQSPQASTSARSMNFVNHDAVDEKMRQQEKKLQKRAANRKSAQLSRKRKKALIEELRYENQDLQRHEDILEVIPDPVFAFDIANGKVWFASASAAAQFGRSLDDLTSACFFDLMTDDCSKRLRVLIDTAAKDVSETSSALLHEVRTHPQIQYAALHWPLNLNLLFFTSRAAEFASYFWHPAYVMAVAVACCLSDSKEAAYFYFY